MRAFCGCLRDCILPHYAAVVFDLDIEIVRGKDTLSEIENFSQRAGPQPMIKIVAQTGLQNAGFRFAYDAAAIDKLLRYITNLRRVKVGWDLIAIGQSDANESVRMKCESIAEFGSFHPHLYSVTGMLSKSICPLLRRSESAWN